jgi:SAM-dependent methyltransferase
MSKIFTTEITSDQLASDNPLHQRLLKPYVISADLIKGDLLEVGCGEGRGIDQMLPHIKSYSAIDKLSIAIESLRHRYPSGKFISGNLPPLPYPDASFDSVVSFQVIEHIQDDKFFLQEIFRVLRPGGIALITTPNRPMSLSRNPWHIREYTGPELAALGKAFFPKIEIKGIGGNEKVMLYHERNRKSVQRIMRWDILDLQHMLPARLLQLPYEFLNRRNRNKLEASTDGLTQSITHEDYVVVNDANHALDLFLIAQK